MTGSDSTAPTRNADDGPPDVTPGNVVPREGLSASRGDEGQSGEAPSEGDGDAAPTGDDVRGHS